MQSTPPKTEPTTHGAPESPANRRTFTSVNMELCRTAVDALVAAGHTLELDDDVPGIMRIDGGPYLTINQVIDVARRAGLLSMQRNSA